MPYTLTIGWVFDTCSWIFVWWYNCQTNIQTLRCLSLLSPVSPYSINSSYFIFVPSLQFMLFFWRISQCSRFLQEILEIFLCFDQFQDDIPILRVGDPKLNLHLPLLLVDPIDNFHILNFSGTESAKRNPATYFFPLGRCRGVPRFKAASRPFPFWN